ncbi:hypothetical protein J5N97_019473 [Dioscorea zingiberensis]|uniref:Uncharacterized protein n=1 Tax=Dioscorea zingiberensis TaxID=325984 RepID=A0A9D5CEP3_9LILI|nr:hypothetical protein J5N97_019473 [Dioscorea zingiberensis]
MLSMTTTTPLRLELKVLHQHPTPFMVTARIINPPGSLSLGKLKPPSARSFVKRASNSDGLPAEANPKPSDIGVVKGNASSGTGYVALFVRMLGLDNDPLDREQAVITLWKYSQGGKDCIDGIMQFPGCINLVVSLLKSDSISTCEAAAGLLRTISSVSIYRNVVIGSGAVEEIVGLLCKSSLTSEVKEQSLGALWNLSTDDKVAVKIADSDFLLMLVKFLDDEETKVKEGAGGVLANLALTPSNHRNLVEAGVIPKLASLLKSKDDSFKVIRKEAKTTLLELCKDEYFRILVTEEGLVRVPLVGAAAYKAFKPVSYSWPSLPDGTEIQRNSRPSRYGASELLLGLNIQDNYNLEEAKMNAMIGRSQQQFLVRIGAIEMEDGKNAHSESSQRQQYTLLPWIDGVARLVLILGLEDVSAISRAAYSIADAATSEHMRISFKEAGAVRLLVMLLHHNDENIKEAAAHALDRLSNSYEVRQIIEAEGALNPLISLLKSKNTSQSLLEKVVNILSSIFDPGKDMKRKFQNKAINGSEEVLTNVHNSHENEKLDKHLDTFLQPDLTTRYITFRQPDVTREMIDSGVISRLVETFRISSPNFQVKIVSILEYVMISESYVIALTEAGIESGLDAVFEQGSSIVMEDYDDGKLELDIIKAEEIGLSIAAASRLLSKLLDFEQFRRGIDSKSYIFKLRMILRSNIPLHAKDWAAACLVKLEAHFGSVVDLGHPINMEVILYETIPRLVEQITTSASHESQEAAVQELYEVVASRGLVDCSRAIATSGGIFPLVKLIDEGRALEASLAILYNLSMDSENHPAIIAAGAVPILKRIVLSEGPQWARALHLLRVLPT